VDQYSGRSLKPGPEFDGPVNQVAVVRVFENAPHDGDSPALCIRPKAPGLAVEAVLGGVQAELLEVGWGKIGNGSCRPEELREAFGDLPTILEGGRTDFAALHLLELAIEVVVARILDRRAFRV
jgi:hypothetical protein